MKSVNVRNLAWVAMTILASISCAQETAVPQATQGLVVLHNGNVIEGVVEQVGDRYRILIGQGEIGVPADKVRLVATSYEDAYQQMREVQRNTVNGHLELSVWCIEHEMFPQAAEEILAAMKLDPDRKEIAIVQRRLVARAKSSAANRHPDVHRIPRPDIVATTTNTSTTASPAGKTAMPNSKPKLENQPNELVLQYRSNILPMLVNSCASNRCHGHAAQGGFELFRPLNRHISKRVVERNWEAVTKWIDPSRPTESILLKMAAQAHGGADEPPLSADDPRWARLSTWVEKQGLSLSSHADDKQAPSNVKHQNRQVNFETPQQQDTAASASAKMGSDGTEQTISDTSQKKSLPKPSAAHPVQTALDPFDPMPFNRRHHPSGPPSAAAPPSSGSTVPALPSIPRR